MSTRTGTFTQQADNESSVAMHILTAVTYAAIPTIRNFTSEALQFKLPKPSRHYPHLTNVAGIELERAAAAYRSWIDSLEEEIEHIEGVNAALLNDQDGELFVLVTTDPNTSWETLTQEIALAIFGDDPTRLDLRDTTDNPYLILHRVAVCA